MKTIYIVRHAKSSWEEIGLSDEQRPLLKKGIKRTQKVTDFLVSKKVRVDHIISSPAVRALETAKLVAIVLGYPLKDIQLDPRIYHTTGRKLFELLFEAPREAGSVMLVGHNPALTDFVNHFLDPRIDNLPTSGVVSVSFETDRWEQLPLAKFKVDFFMTPRMIQN